MSSLTAHHEIVVLGGVPMVSSSGGSSGGAIEGLVLEHGVEDVASSSREEDQGGVVLLALGAFAVVVGAAGRVKASVGYGVNGWKLGSSHLVGAGVDRPRCRVGD